MRIGRGRDDRGIGGFLESILAVMVVITASSVFMVILSASTMQEGPEMDGDELIDALCEQGLWVRDGGLLEYDLLEMRFASIMDLPMDLNGICLTYRTMGGTEPLLAMGVAAPMNTTVYSEQAPLLLSLDGRTVPAMVEVRAW